MVQHLPLKTNKTFMKKALFVTGLLTFLIACSNNGTEDKKTETTPTTTEIKPASDPNDQGIGKFRDVKIDPKLDASIAAKGLAVYDMKCAACHKLTEERLVGPGWKGVTSRRRAEWVMNFVTNTDEMLSKDPTAQAQLEVCLVRMPNQSLTDQDARNVVEFMRKNDGVQ